MSQWLLPYYFRNGLAQENMDGFSSGGSGATSSRVFLKVSMSSLRMKVSILPILVFPIISETRFRCHYVILPFRDGFVKRDNTVVLSPEIGEAHHPLQGVASDFRRIIPR